MKVLFISRATLFTDKGGDTIQVVNTAGYLKALGITVEIRLCNEQIEYSGFDFIHFFNIIRPADILIHIQRSGKPFAISTIYVDYTEYEKNVRKGLTRLLTNAFSPDQIEYLKVIARFLLNGEKIMSPSFLLLGQRKAIQAILKKATVILPNSLSEYQRVKKKYGISNNFRVIPNAIDTAIFRKTEEKIVKDPQLVICIARIEERKNQLNLIRALSNTRYNLVIIGSVSENQAKYYESCKKEAGPNVLFINGMSQENLVEYYRKAKVHVLASWFETTGLSSLEAAAMQCNIVVTEKGDTREYFENYAFYCDPSSPASILEAVNNAAAGVNDGLLQKKIYEQYTWNQTAAETLKAYQEFIPGL